MKLHFSKDWVASKKTVDADPQVSVGSKSDLSEILNANERYEWEQRWSEFPLRAMADLRWISASIEDIGRRPRDLVLDVVDTFLSTPTVSALYRRTDGAQDLFSWLWVGRLLQRSDSFVDLPDFNPSKLNLAAGRALAKLSIFEDGPSRAQDCLQSKGIALIVERALPGSRLDGAAFITERGIPVIGLTLRYDRLDYFWFTLMHEFAHMAMHTHTHGRPFVENLDGITEDTDPLEQEADYFAQEALIPRRIWRRSDAYRRQTVELIRQLANELEIHPAIIAGRIRKDRNRYDLFTNLVGNNLVRRHFPDSGWT